MARINADLSNGTSIVRERPVSGFYSVRFYTSAAKTAKFLLNVDINSGQLGDGNIGELFQYWAQQCTAAGGVVELNISPNVPSAGVPQNVGLQNLDGSPFVTFLQNNTATNNQTRLVFPKPPFQDQFSDASEGWGIRVSLPYLFGSGTGNGFVLKFIIPAGGSFPDFTLFSKNVAKESGQLGNERSLLIENTLTRVSPFGSLLQNGFVMNISVFDGDVTFGDPELNQDDISFLICN